MLKFRPPLVAYSETVATFEYRLAAGYSITCVPAMEV